VFDDLAAGSFSGPEWWDRPRQAIRVPMSRPSAVPGPVFPLDIEVRLEEELARHLTIR
jgi:hypothetical protein